jgi:polyisoprenyl-teichoic acid--peptidoglycan teichoic acid transferase
VSLIPRSRRGTLARSALAAVLVIVFTASATAVAGLLQFKQLVKELSGHPALAGLHDRVKIPTPGAPQTLLLIGSDHRAGTPWSASNTDTMMLVHIDPNSSTINLLSVPRDLQVQIPQGGALGTGKLNSAYSIGGPGLLIRILKQQVFPGLQINHVIDVNFGGFEALVNAIGCVYTDVDHRYYNNTAVTNYSSIDVQPGYQPLCGSDALAFVRFRHTDTDIVRNARQQDFLRWAKAQFSTTELLSEKDKLVRIFGAHTQTDANLHTLDGLINLFDLVVFSAGHTIKQVPFPAILLPCDVATGASPCYVTADPGAEHHAFSQFMAPTVPANPGGSASGGVGKHGAGPGRPGPVPDLTGDLSDGKAQAAALGSVGFPIYFPRVVSAGSYYCFGATGNCPAQIQTTGAYPRSYQLRDRSGHDHYAYRMTLALNPVLGQYYGVQGTTWLNPPILDSPTQTRNVGGKQLLIYANGGKVSLVAWRHNGSAYWISNTLNDQIGNAQMIAIAASLTH